MSWLEWVAAGFGVANIVLLLRRSVWNYPFGLVMVSLYAVVFFHSKLYSDMVLQGFFCVVQIYGWVQWQAAAVDDAVPVRRLDPSAYAPIAGISFAAYLLWSGAMDTFTDAAAPWVDGAIAMFSVSAQILLARRFIENWWLWIGVDLIAVPLFAWRELYLTSGLYALFLILSIAGLREWRRSESAAA